MGAMGTAAAMPAASGDGAAPAGGASPGRRSAGAAGPAARDRSEVPPAAIGGSVAPIARAIRKTLSHGASPPWNGPASQIATHSMPAPRAAAPSQRQPRRQATASSPAVSSSK